MGSLINNYSKEELEQIVKTSFSYAEVLSRLGYSTVHGKNHKTLKDRLEYYQISTNHFSHKARRKWTDEEIFCEDSKVSQHKLRCTFKEKAIVPYECAICGLPPFWNDKPLVLTLDHKNGKNKDNRIENLQWVCPNCDRQSDTYGYKNKKVLKKGTILYAGDYSKTQEEAEAAMLDYKEKSLIKNSKHTLEKDGHYYCIDCGKMISRNTSRCVECASINKRKVQRPTKDELFNLLKIHKGNFSFISELYGVSDNAIRKWCKRYNLPTHTYDYIENKITKNLN